MAAPVMAPALRINLDALFEARLLSGSHIYCGVLIVQETPYVRLTHPDAANATHLVYQAPASGGGPGAPSVPTEPPKPR